MRYSQILNNSDRSLANLAEKWSNNNKIKASNKDFEVMIVKQVIEAQLEKSKEEDKIEEK